MQLTPALTDSQVEQVHRATIDVLQNGGFRVMHEDALRRWQQAGAKVDEVSGIVRVPEQLLSELLGQVPSFYTVTGVDGQPRTIGQGKQWVNAIVTDPWIVDYETALPHRPRLEELRRNTIVAQNLDVVVGISRMDFPVSDVEGPHSSQTALLEHLLYHTKHYFVYVTSAESLAQWIEIGDILSGDKALKGSRLFTIAVASLTPLSITEMNVELMKVACEYDFPIIPTICPAAGTTSPMSNAGTLVLGNAENIFLAAQSQLYRSGQPFIYTLGPSVTNMRTSLCMYYTLDKVLWKNAHVQMAKYYGLPATTECGGSMTYRPDQQSGLEGILFMMSAVASGADLLAGFGSTYNAVGHSTEMMLIQDAYRQAAKFLQDGIRTDAKHLAADAIKQVGPGGHYMTDELTLEYMRGGEFFQSDLFDLSGELADEPSMTERAHAKVTEMLEQAESPLPGNLQDALKRHFHDRVGTNK